jgi:hypothetical protein
MQLKKIASFMLLLTIGLVLVACNTVTTTTPTTTASTTSTTTTTTTAPTTTTTTTTTATPTTTTTTTTVPTTTLAPVLSVLGDLKDGNEGVYNIRYESNVAYIAFNKHVFSWPAFEVASEEALSRFNKLVLTVQGEGSLLIRLIGADMVYEATVPLSSVNVTHQLDLRVYDSFLGGLEKIEFVVNPGVAGEQGELVLSKLEFDTGSPFGNVVVIEEPGVNAMYGFVTNDAGKYTLTTLLNGSVRVAYDKPVDFEWSFINNVFNVADVAGLNTLTISIQGTAGKQVLLKPNDFWATEKMVTLDGTVQTFTFTAAAFVNMIIFAEPNTVAAGEFTILDLTLSYVPETDYGFFGSADVPVNVNWTGDVAGLEFYDFVVANDILTISYDRPADKNWTWLRYNLPVYYYGVHNALEIQIKGEAGKQAIIKPNDFGPWEKTITFTGELQTVILPTTGVPTFLIVFSDPILGSLTGSYEIHSIKTLYVPVGANVTEGFAQNDPNTYAFVTNPDGSVTVNYTKGAGQEWAYANTIFLPASTVGKNTMLILLSGTPGKQVLLKPNDSGALEKWVTFTDDQPVWVWVSAETFTNMIIFAEAGIASVTGSFTIHGVYLSYEVPLAVSKDEIVDFTFGWVDNGNTGMYTFATVGTTNVVTYNKVNNQYQNIKLVFEDNLMNMNTMTLVLKGTAGKSILVKPNDKGALEFTVNFTGEEQTIVVTLDETLTQIIIFAEINLANASGSFEIISATVSWEAIALDVNNGWTEGEAGTYAFVTNPDGSVTVNYTKTAAQSWTYMISNYIAAEVAGYNTITMVIQGTAGKQAYLKPNDLGGAVEVNLTFSGEPQTFVWTFATGFSKFVILAEGGTPSVTGSFTIISVVLSYVPPVAE